MKCDDYLYVNVDGVTAWKIPCDREEGHDGSHVFYGDNYKMIWLTKEHLIENYAGEVITEEMKEKCKKNLIVENLMEGIF